jgi:pSer/pThr/pTyr-binding forkhead associated (FHA) protein
MSVKLTVAGGPTQTRVIEMRRAKAVIGRAKGCDVRIPSAEVSREHCVLRFEDGFLSVEDLDSFNGTMLNGRRITGTERVCPGDQLRVGPVTFEVDYPLQVVENDAETPAKAGPSEAPQGEPRKKAKKRSKQPAAPPPEPAAAEGEQAEELVVELDESESVNLPEGADWREILGGLE